MVNAHDNMRVTVVVPSAFLLAAPHADSEAVSSSLYGELLSVFAQDNGYYRVEAVRDGYVGWILTTEVSQQYSKTTHSVAVRQATIFSKQDIKSTIVRFLPFGCEVAVRATAGRWSILSDGTFMISNHLKPNQHRQTDQMKDPPITLAETLFMGAPYVWGGKSPNGADCSGMVQSCYYASGYLLPRDSGPQLDSLKSLKGQARRHAIAGFRGHIGLMVDETHLIHANAHSMSVLIEPLKDVVDRVVVDQGGDAYLGLFACPLGYSDKR